MSTTETLSLTLVEPSEWSSTYFKDFLNALAGSGSSSNMQKIDAAAKTASEHIAAQDNPHNVTAKQIGLGAVDNTSDADKPISTATQAALNSITSQIGDIASLLDSINGEVI